jgi:hypothetical protein
MTSRTTWWKSSTAVLIALLALFLALPTASAHAEHSKVGIVPINGTAAGLTYGQWSVRWWQYAFSLTTLNNCPNEPGGPMFFLVGTPGGSTTPTSCTVPAGKFIMFPIFNAEWSQAEARALFQTDAPTRACPVLGLNGKPITGTEDFTSLSQCAQAQAQKGLPSAGATLEADVDGQMLNHLSDFRASSPAPLFPFTSVDGNFLGLGPLSSQAAADGFWIILNPLASGKHTIHFKAVIPFFSFTVEGTYSLTVQ